MDIYVGNLSYSCTDADLQSFFSQYGTVASARVVTDRMSGQSKGFGFVEMPDAEEAQKAIASANGQDFMGRPLRANESQPKPRAERPRGGDRGDDRGERGIGRGGFARY